MKNTIFFTVFILGIFIHSCQSKRNIERDSIINDESFNRLKERIKRSDGNYYSQYEGQIKSVKKGEDYIFYYIFDNTNYEIRVSHKYYSDYLPLFENGVLHPNLIGGITRNILSIGRFEEVSNSSDNTKRRYKLWTWCEGHMNPCEYIIELLNETATKSTPTSDFIKKAQIVDISPCSIIL